MSLRSHQFMNGMSLLHVGLQAHVHEVPALNVCLQALGLPEHGEGEGVSLERRS